MAKKIAPLSRRDMFTLAILIGIYSYLIFILGLLGLLYKQTVISTTVLFFCLVLFIFKSYFKNFKEAGVTLKRLGNSRLAILTLGLITLQAGINFIGALGPELSFDALWYHLTLPKLYLISHRIYYISGGLLYYSGMPKLGEMLYVSCLSIDSEILAKITHFSFGLLCLIALYKVSRKFFSSKISLVASLIFYANLVVGWQSTTAYIDLMRTFFEVMALWAFINWWEKEEQKWLIESAVMIGLAISTKLLAIGSLFIFSVLIIYKLINQKNKTIVNLTTDILVYWCTSLLIASPWLVFSFIHTGNPVYPLFTEIYQVDVNLNLFNPLVFLAELWDVFTRAADPLSPLYLIFFPLIILAFTQFKRELKMITIYCLLGLIVWYFTPRSGGGRFILPYLPALSIMVVAAIEKFEKNNLLKNSFLILICVTSLFSIIYRGVANAKYLPVILNQESKSQFLSKSLNFSFGDFYDIDNYFKANIKHSDKVLLYGFHNLYYVDFPFIDSSWVKKGNTFNYVAVLNGELPERFRYWNLIYQNPKTQVKLYSAGGQRWIY